MSYRTAIKKMIAVELNNLIRQHGSYHFEATVGKYTVKKKNGQYAKRDLIGVEDFKIVPKCWAGRKELIFTLEPLGDSSEVDYECIEIPKNRIGEIRGLQTYLDDITGGCFERFYNDWGKQGKLTAGVEEVDSFVKQVNQEKKKTLQETYGDSYGAWA